MGEQLDLLPDLLGAHLRLSLLALLLGAGISLPLGVFITRRERLQGPVLGVAGVIQTIPSLALLAFMVPVLGFIGAITADRFGVRISAIGFWPALIALTLYSILPMLQNTVTGIANVDPALKEAALGVGMTERQRLRMVELPQALPVIVAGVRTATVWVVGMATISTPVGAPSLGNYIFTGLQTRNYAAVSVGCIAAALLALLLDNTIRLLQLGTEQRRRSFQVGAGLIVLGLLVFALVPLVRPLVAPESPIDPVTVGAKPYTEQYILSHVLAGRIARETPYETEVVQSLGSSIVFDGLKNGDVDAYVDFSGTIWATVMKRTDIPADRRELLERVTAHLQEEHGIVVVGTLGFENRYAFAMRRKQAEALGVRTVSDLVPHAGALTLASDYEFFGRTEWKSVQEKYGIEFASTRTMGSQLMYQACAQGDVDVITAYTTDGRIDALDLVVLEDDRHAIPPYHAIILLNGEVATKRPGVVESLQGLVGTIDEKEMRRMNHAVDAEGRTPQRVASEFLDALDD